jgi:glutathione S-transferase
MLETRGGQYFAGNQISVADLKAFIWIRKLRSGLLDHIPVNLVDTKAPNLAAHQERISTHPGIAAYYARRA